MKPPTRTQLACWVKQPWDKIPTELIKKSFVVCGVSNALDNSEDERINVLKPDGVLSATRQEVLHKLKQLTEANGDLNNLETPSEEEDTDATAENELVVDDEDFDEDDNIPLADFLL